MLNIFIGDYGGASHSSFPKSKGFPSFCSIDLWLEHVNALRVYTPCVHMKIKLNAELVFDPHGSDVSTGVQADRRAQA